MAKFSTYVGMDVHANKARMAVVREMARRIWVIGLQVQSELANA